MTSTSPGRGPRRALTVTRVRASRLVATGLGAVTAITVAACTVTEPDRAARPDDPGAGRGAGRAHGRLVGRGHATEPSGRGRRRGRRQGRGRGRRVGAAAAGPHHPRHRAPPASDPRPGDRAAERGPGRHHCSGPGRPRAARRTPRGAVADRRRGRPCGPAGPRPRRGRPRERGRPHGPDRPGGRDRPPAAAEPLPPDDAGPGEGARRRRGGAAERRGRHHADARRHRPAGALAPLAPRLRRADLTVGNLESTLSRAGAPTQGGDSFGADPGIVGPLRRAGPRRALAGQQPRRGLRRVRDAHHGAAAPRRRAATVRRRPGHARRGPARGPHP